MNSTMIIYHGSPSIIENPKFGAGNPRNDYGLGFYCTEEIELAKEWACVKGKGGVANRYSLNMDGLKVMHLSGSEYHILNWLSILLNNRIFSITSDIAAQSKEYLTQEFMPPYEQYDIIKGYRADDSYFAFAGAFLNNTISLEQLAVAMRLGKLGEQIVLRSKKAFHQITYLGNEPAEDMIYYPKRVARDNAAREAFRQERKIARASDAVYMLDILREEWKNDDSRLFRNLS